MDRNVKTLAYLSLLTALCTVATMAIPIPTPTGGYLNAGDIVVVLTALLTGPVYGGLVGGLGSALADLFMGYAVYAPGTLIVKGAAAVVIGMVFRAARKKEMTAAVTAAICGAFITVLGFFAYEALFLGFGLGAIAEIPGNLLQTVVGIAGGVLLYHALMRIPEIRRFSESTMNRKKQK